MSDDQSRRFTLLRASTAKLLGYDDADRLTAAQQIRLDRAITLRLMIDDLQGRQVRGEVIDVKAFVNASEDLERMVPGGNPEAPSGTHDFSGAREELSRFFAGRAEAIKRRNQRLEVELATNPDAARRELETKIQAAIEKHTKPAVGGDAQSSVAPPLSSAAPAVGGGWPTEPASTPQSAPPPGRVESDVERMNRVNSRPVPQHYLKGPPEPWRDYIDADGNIHTSPWRR
jgi:hypothetical protein